VQIIDDLKILLLSLGDNIDPWLSIILCSILFTLAILGTHPIRITDEKGLFSVCLIWVRRTTIIAFAFFIVFTPILTFLLSLMVFETSKFAYLLAGECLNEIKSNWWVYLGCFFIPMLWRWAINRHLPTFISTLKRKYALRVSKDSLSDIRTEVSKIKTKVYEVEKYFKDGFFFIGLDDKEKPIYVSDEEFKKNNIKCIGPSQTGKGVLQQVLISQAIIKGWNVIFIDQKPDDFIPDVMRETCEKQNRKLVKLDLTGETKGTYCPFSGGTERERYFRFVNVAGLNDTGSDGDFYKGAERAAISEIIPHWDGSIKTLDDFISGRDKSLIDKIGEYKANKHLESLNKVKSQITEWKYLKPVNAKSGRGFNVERTLKENGVAIIRGSVSDKTIIKFTKAIIDEITSTVLRLGKNNKPAHTFLVIDEARFIISDEIAKALATMLSKGCSTMINYQSVLDTENLDDKNLNAKSVSQTINVNTNYTICYRAKDPETAEWLSEQTGTIQKSVARMENVERNRHGGEVWSEFKSLNNVEETLIHSNLAMSLPNQVAIFLMPNELAKICFTSWITVNEQLGMKDKKLNIIEQPKISNERIEPVFSDSEAKPVNDNTASDSEAKPVNDNTASDSETKPVNDNTTSDSEAKPVNDNTASDSEAKPVNDNTASDSEAKPVNDNTASDSEAKPVNDNTTSDSEAKPVNDNTASDSETKPVNDNTASDSEAKPVNDNTASDSEAKKKPKPISNDLLADLLKKR